MYKHVQNGMPFKYNFILGASLNCICFVGYRKFAYFHDEYMYSRETLAFMMMPLQGERKTMRHKIQTRLSLSFPVGTPFVFLFNVKWNIKFLLLGFFELLNVILV